MPRRCQQAMAAGPACLQFCFADLQRNGARQRHDNRLMTHFEQSGGCAACAGFRSCDKDAHLYPAFKKPRSSLHLDFLTRRLAQYQSLTCRTLSGHFKTRFAIRCQDQPGKLHPRAVNPGQCTNRRAPEEMCLCSEYPLRNLPCQAAANPPAPKAYHRPGLLRVCAFWSEHYRETR